MRIFSYTSRYWIILVLKSRLDCMRTFTLNLLSEQPSVKVPPTVPSSERSTLISTVSCRLS